jgi:hypothetical protein
VEAARGPKRAFDRRKLPGYQPPPTLFRTETAHRSFIAGKEGTVRMGEALKASPQIVKAPLALTKETIRRHLEGEITIGMYAISPSTQRCK